MMLQHPLSDYLKRGVINASPLLFVFLLYLYTVSPAIYWRDGPEFIITGWTLGISHPPGHPLYNQIGKGFSFLPFGDIAFRFNLLSLISGLFTILFLYLMTLKSLLYLSKEMLLTDNFYPSNRTLKVVSMFSTALFALSTSFWMNTADTEVYTINALFLVVELYLAIMWIESEDHRYLFTGSLIYGLSTGVHGGVVFFLPGLVLFLFINRKLLKIRDLFLTAFFFLLGFSVYLYLPVRSLSNPTFDWGNPETLGNFLRHITDQKDKGIHKAILNVDLYKRSIFYMKMLIDELTPLGFLMLIPGIIINIRTNRKIFILLAGTAAGNTLFFFPYWSNGIAFIPTILIMTFWVAMGFYACLIYVKKYEQKGFVSRKLAVSVMIVFVFFSFFKNFSNANRYSYYVPYVTARESYLSQKKDAITITLLLWFPFRYLQDIERMRDDVDIINLSDIRSPDYFNPLTEERFPGLCIPDRNNNWENFISSFISCNIERHPIYWEPSLYNKKIYRNLRPQSFLFRIVPEESETISDEELKRYLQWLDGFLKREFERIDIFNEMEAQTYYNHFLSGIADYLILVNREGYAINIYRILKSIKPEDMGIDNLIAFCYARLGNFKKAREIYEGILEGNPDDLISRIGLGMVYLSIGERVKAKAQFEWVLREKDDPWALYGMGRIATLEGDLSTARSYYDRALSAGKDEELRKMILKELEK